MLPSFRRALAMSVITLSAVAAAPAIAEPLKVVASFTVIADFAKNVGGNRITLTTIVGPNGDAHVYEPKPADAVAMAKADVVLVNGLHFEGFLRRLVEASATGAQIVELTKGVKTVEFKPEFAEAEEDHAADAEADHAEHGHDHGVIDPHAFQSVANAKIYVKNIADAFCVADAAGCDDYKANAAAYTRKLDALDGDVRAAIGAIAAEVERTPAVARHLVVQRVHPGIVEVGRLGVRAEPAGHPGRRGHQRVQGRRQLAGVHLVLLDLLGHGLQLGLGELDLGAVAAAEDARGRERHDPADQDHHHDDLDQREAALGRFRGQARRARLRAGGWAKLGHGRVSADKMEGTGVRDIALRTPRW